MFLALSHRSLFSEKTEACTTVQGFSGLSAARRSLFSLTLTHFLQCAAMNT